MNDPIKLILSLSLSGSILAGLIFALKPLTRHRLSKAIQYYLWLVVLIRLIMPFSFTGSMMDGLFDRSSAPVAVSSPNYLQPAASDGTPVSDSSLWPTVQEDVKNGVYNDDIDHSRYLQNLISQNILYFWLLGVLIMLTVNITGYVRFAKHLRKRNKPATDEDRRVLGTIWNGRRQISLFRNPFVPTPMLVGIIRPYIIIPDKDFDHRQLKNILRHEMTHLRRWDVAVKWLTMIAVSIHWFNPLIYLVKREINHACELACDEAVIIHLSPGEKQAYGETLIAVVAEHHYPFVVLQATMCEEKKSLKERLQAIMSHHKKSRLAMVISAVLLAAAVMAAVALGACVGNAADQPPQIYISAEWSRTKTALSGSYQWKSRGKIILADADHPRNFKYQFENILDAAAEQQIIISTEKLKMDKRDDFTIDQLAVYRDGQIVPVKSPEPVLMDGNLYLLTPADTGEYVYSLRLNYPDRGIVTYGFVVRVNMLFAYDLAEIAKYRTPYVGNSKVSAIVSRLPVPDSYFKQQYIALATKSRPYQLTVFYEAKPNAMHSSEWPIVPQSTTYANLGRNALVLLSMIDNLDAVTFAFRDSASGGQLNSDQYKTSFTFTRTELAEKYGEISLLGQDLNSLQEALSQ